MIQGVITKQIVEHHDERGYFSELVKMGEPTYRGVAQTSFSQTHPGVIKAFHWHKETTEMWCPLFGNAQIVLYDLRLRSETKGKTQVIHAGGRKRMVIVIPPGVAHGYRVLGGESFGMLYHASIPYNPKDPDEFRIPFDSKRINFDWETKNQ